MCIRDSLDNDPVGRQALLTIQSSGVTVEDMSRHYARHKDPVSYTHLDVYKRQVYHQGLQLQRTGVWLILCN